MNNEEKKKAFLKGKKFITTPTGTYDVFSYNSGGEYLKIYERSDKRYYCGVIDITARGFKYRGFFFDTRAEGLMPWDKIEFIDQ